MQKSLHFPVSRLATVPSQQGCHPVFREKDVACALHLLQFLQRRTDVFHGIAVPQGMVQVAQRRCRPRLYPPVFRLQEGTEKGITSQRVRRDGTGNKIKLPQTVRIGYPPPLGYQYLRTLLRETQRQFVSQGGIIALIQQVLRGIFPDIIEIVCHLPGRLVRHQHTQQLDATRSKRMGGCQTKELLLRHRTGHFLQSLQRKGKIRNQRGSYQRIFLCPDAFKQKGQPIRVREITCQIILIQLHQQGLPCRLVRHFRPMLQYPKLATGIRNKQAVSASIHIGNSPAYPERKVQPQQGVAHVHFHQGIAFPQYLHIETLPPQQPPPVGVPLLYFQLIALGIKINVRHALFMHPHPAECFQIHIRMPVQDTHQIFPIRVAVSVGAHIVTDAFPEILPPHQFHQLFHHDRRLVINNLPVNQTGIAQVPQILLDGIRPQGTVLRQRSRRIGTQPIQLMVHLREHRFRDTCRKVIGKHFFRPNIIKPFHGDIVPKPHVGGLMGYQLSPP